MAEDRKWNRKGVVLSDVTAQKEYGVIRDFIVKGIQAGKPANLNTQKEQCGATLPRVPRSQLGRDTIEVLGSGSLAGKRPETELRTISKEIAELRQDWLNSKREKLNLNARSSWSASPLWGTWPRSTVCCRQDPPVNEL
jgi:hypothetical protein